MRTQYGIRPPRSRVACSMRRGRRRRRMGDVRANQGLHRWRASAFHDSDHGPRTKCAPALLSCRNG
eukprot:4587792-Alexandrium_andersonii.AAC.1